MPRNGTGSWNGVLLMRRPLWEKLWAKQFLFHSPTKPRETPLRQQSLLLTSLWMYSPQLASGMACGWDRDFPWQGHMHGWGSCKPPSPSGPWALIWYSHFSVLVLTTSHARVCSWASLARCLSSVNRHKCLFISAEAVHHFYNEPRVHCAIMDSEMKTKGNTRSFVLTFQISQTINFHPVTPGLNPTICYWLKHSRCLAKKKLFAWCQLLSQDIQTWLILSFMWEFLALANHLCSFIKSISFILTCLVPSVICYWGLSLLMFQSEGLIICDHFYVYSELSVKSILKWIEIVYFWELYKNIWHYP